MSYSALRTIFSDMWFGIRTVDEESVLDALILNSLGNVIMIFQYNSMVILIDERKRMAIISSIIS